MRSQIKVLLGFALIATVSAQHSGAMLPLACRPSSQIPLGLMLLQASAASSSQETRTHLQKAEQYLREKRPDLAIPEFAAVVASEPNNLDAQANLGVLLFFAGKPNEA